MQTRLVNLTGNRIKVAERHEKGHVNPVRIKRVLDPHGIGVKVVRPKRESLLDGLDVIRTANARVVGLPEPEESVIYIVPGDVLELCPNRLDLLAMGNTYKDPTGDGEGVLCTHFIGHAEN